ncbi:MAG TPA: EamA family transporter [Anaerolineales bacterium]|jgi:uncharacterized membrane protein|nr:EamA family transporter [Anaerolineales bacterium]
MNNTILLATISMACAGLASFSNKIATENQILFPTYLLMTSIPYFGLILILQNTAKEPMTFTRLSVTLGIIGGALGCIAFYTAYTALSRGGQGSIIFPITSLQVVIPVVLSYLIFKEPLTLTKLSGLGFSVLALILLTR